MSSIGNLSLSGIYLGGNIKEAYVGEHKVFSAGEPMPDGYERVQYLELKEGVTSAVQYDFNSVETSAAATDNILFKFRVGGYNNYNAYTFSVPWYPNYVSCNNTSVNFVYTLTNGNIYSTNLLKSYDGSYIDFEILKNGNTSTNITYTYNGLKKEVMSGRIDVYASFGNFFCVRNQNAGARFYEYDVFDGDSTNLKNNIVAARKISDGSPAIIDTVTKKVTSVSSIWYKTSKDK